jgi:hypothetical protein
MKSDYLRAASKKPRIGLTAKDIDSLFEIHGTKVVADLSKRTGLPYLQIYNLVHGRISSVSDRHYRMLFRKPAPPRAAIKIDGTFFRAMVDLWLYLHEGVTRTDLCREFFKTEQNPRVDHRIFSGKVRTVHARFEYIMRQKFLAAGLDDKLLHQWLAEYQRLDHADRVPYSRIRPLLQYLENNLGIRPNSILNQSVVRYESGELQHVSQRIFENAARLKEKAKKALDGDGECNITKIREVLLGGREGYTLFADVKAELLFLRAHAGKSVKYYLGRGLWTYESGKAIRIPSWRARKIMTDCERFISQFPHFPIAALPAKYRWRQVRRLTTVLVARSTQLLTEREALDFEKNILQPSRLKIQPNRPYQDFTSFDMAPRTLGMKRRAFDLMVARHCDIFRAVGKFHKRWYLPDDYLKELSRKKGFELILAKYEWMAKTMRTDADRNACLN